MQLYKKAFEQKVNMDKSGIYFSSNTSVEDKSLVRQILNIHTAMEDDKYLGIHILVSKDKYKIVRSIEERM